MAMISSGVGAGQANVSDDVAEVQTLLNDHTDVTGQTLLVDGGISVGAVKATL